MDKVTAEQIRAALPAGANAWWPIRECSMCSAPIGYDFTASGDVFFKSACFCTDLGGYDLRDIENVVDCFNRQTPEIRARMWGEFEKAISSGELLSGEPSAERSEDSHPKMTPKSE